MENQDGYLVGKKTLQRYDETARRVLGSGGGEGKQTQGPDEFFRKPKFVKTPSSGITTSDPTQPGSATCKVMEWNGDWTQLTENTDIEETVYSLETIAGDTIVEVKPVAGRLFATPSGGDSSGGISSYVYWAGSLSPDLNPPLGGTTVSETGFSGADVYNVDSSSPDFTTTSGVTSVNGCYMWANLTIRWSYGLSYQIGTSPTYAVPANTTGLMTLDNVDWLGGGGSAKNDFNSGCFHFGATTPTNHTFHGDQTWNTHASIAAGGALGVNFNTVPQTGASANTALTQFLISFGGTLTILAISK